jgi:hypothetical protein
MNSSGGVSEATEMELWTLCNLAESRRRKNVLDRFRVGAIEQVNSRQRLWPWAEVLYLATGLR